MSGVCSRARTAIHADQSICANRPERATPFYHPPLCQCAVELLLTLDKYAQQRAIAELESRAAAALANPPSQGVG